LRKYQARITAKRYICHAVLPNFNPMSFKILFFLCLTCGVYAQSLTDSLEQTLQNKLPDTTRLNTFYDLAAELRTQNPRKALQYGQQGLILAEKMGKENYAAELYTSIALIYFVQAEYSLSLENHLKALRTYEKLKDEYGVAQAYGNIGVLYKNQNKNTEALQYHQKGLAIFRKLKDESAVARSLNNIGVIYKNQEKYLEALPYLEESLKLKQKAEDKRGQANTLANLGIIYSKQNKITQAVESQSQALRLFTEEENQEGIALIHFNLSEVYLLQRDFTKATENAQKSLSIAKKLNTKRQIREAVKVLYQIEYQQANYQSASDYQAQYIALNDSIYTEESAKALAEMQTKYETEKKEKKILQLNLEKETQRNWRIFFVIIAALLLVILAILWRFYRLKIKTNTLLGLKNAELEILNATKDKLFAVIAHDLKNPLSAFRSITQSLSNNVFNISKEEINYFLQELNRTSSGLYDLLQNLLQWAVTQSGRLPFQPEQIDLCEIATENICLLEANANEKRLIIDNQISAETLAFADKNMVKTIVRNLLSNAIKFTPEGGEIRITAEKQDPAWLMHIQDTGIGIASGDVPKLFKIEADTHTIGQSEEKGTGLGLILCKELVEKNQGKICVKSELGKGSVFSFSVPVVS
jgi:signal transduction histidine kinase